ncbi:MAG TPA: hypothetical protein VM842_03825 [Nitrospira sp.]|nr:hypothetical protein [Nitrospira sp.]
MIEDYLLDMEDSSGPMWLQAWRCMNCGNVFDSILEHNRLTHGVKPVSEIFPLPTVEAMDTSIETMTRLVA